MLLIWSVYFTFFVEQVYKEVRDDETPIILLKETPLLYYAREQNDDLLLRCTI